MDTVPISKHPCTMGHHLFIIIFAVSGLCLQVAGAPGNYVSEAPICDDTAHHDACAVSLVQVNARTIFKSLTSAVTNHSLAELFNDTYELKRGPFLPFFVHSHHLVAASTATDGTQENMVIYALIALVVVFFLGGTILCIILLILARIVGKMIEEAIETMDKEILGVDVEIDSLSVDLFQARITMYGLQVMNPEGWDDNPAMPNMLSAKEVVVDLNLLKLLCSRLGTFAIQEFTLKSVNLNYYKGLTNSNLNVFLEGLSGKEEEQTAKAQAAEKEADKEDAPDPPTVIILRKIEICDVGATVPILGRRALPDIQQDDFDKEHGEKCRTAGTVGVGLAKLMAKSVFDSLRHLI